MAEQNQHELLLKQKLATVSGTSPDDWFIVSRARHGMELVFRQFADKKGKGTIITQPFTCVTAVNPIIAAGMTPIYCDISKETFSINTSKLSEVVNESTRAVIIQHSFGIPAGLKDIKNQLKQKGLLIVEDSAHCLGFIEKREGLPLADVSVHSFGAEKFLKTNFGGAIWINPSMTDKLLREGIVKAFESLPKASLIVSLRVWLYPRFNGILNRLPASISRSCRGLLIGTGLFRSPIMPMEQKAINFEPCQRLRSNHIKKILTAFDSYQQHMSHRGQLTSLYSDLLFENNGKFEVSAILKSLGLVTVRFPLLASSKEEAERLFVELRNKGMLVGKWYRPLLFPGVDNYDAYGYTVGSCPVAEDVSAKIINLPTGLNTTLENAKEIANALVS